MALIIVLGYLGVLALSVDKFLNSPLKVVECERKERHKSMEALFMVLYNLLL
jgi:hypothetical protein